MKSFKYFPGNPYSEACNASLKTCHKNFKQTVRSAKKFYISEFAMHMHATKIMGHPEGFPKYSETCL